MDVVDAVYCLNTKFPLALLQIAAYHAGGLKVVEVLGMETCVGEEAEVSPKRFGERNDFSKDKEKWLNSQSNHMQKML